MKYGYDLGAGSYGWCRVVRARKAYTCDGVVAYTPHPPVESGEEVEDWEGPYIGMGEDCTHSIAVGDVYLYQFFTDEDGPSALRCCIACALERHVVVAVDGAR